MTGINAPLEDYVDIVGLADWSFTLHTPAGSLVVPLPDHHVLSGADRDPFPDRTTTRLDSDLLFTGPLAAYRAFAAADGAGATLVLSGHANHCWSAGSLSHWTLDVRGERGDFRLFGAFADN